MTGWINLSLMGKVKLVEDSLACGNVVHMTDSTHECLCHHQVISVNVQHLASPFMEASTSQLLPTDRCGCLVVDEGGDWRLILEL